MLYTTLCNRYQEPIALVLIPMSVPTNFGTDPSLNLPSLQCEVQQIQRGNHGSLGQSLLITLWMENRTSLNILVTIQYLCKVENSLFTISATSITRLTEILSFQQPSLLGFHMSRTRSSLSGYSLEFHPARCYIINIKSINYEQYTKLYIVVQIVKLP